MNNNEELRLNIYALLKICNEALAKGRDIDKEELQNRLLERLKTRDVIKIPLNVTEEDFAFDDATLEDKILLSGIFMKEMTTRIDRYAKMVMFGKKLGFNYFCDFQGQNTKELSESFEIMREVSEGKSSVTNIQTLAAYIASLREKARSCVLGIITGAAIRIDIFLGLLLILRIMGKF